MNGVILQTYGSGNFPSNRTDLLELLKFANERGVIIVNCSQCSRGTTSNIYATGQVLIKEEEWFIGYMNEYFTKDKINRYFENQSDQYLLTIPAFPEHSKCWSYNWL